jgi:hypothetical protein
MEPELSRGLDRVESSRLMHAEDDISRDLRSGDTLTLITDDPVNKPLPSFKLLHMQWILQRITAMSGAAIDPSLPDDDDHMSSNGNTIVEPSCDSVFN